MFSGLNINRVSVNQSQATTPSLIRIVSVNVSNAVAGWCWAIFDRRGSSVLTHVSVSARMDRS